MSRSETKNKESAAPLDSPLADCLIREYRKEDRAAAEALGMHVMEWWYATEPEASLHLVAVKTDTEEIVGHLQARDRSVPEPSRRPGQCQFTLNVAPDYRRRGIGGALYDHLERFARQRQARLLYTSYIETPDAPATTFLQRRGFEPLERFCPSYLDVTAFEPALFEEAIRRVTAQDIRLLTYAEVEDSPQNRRKLYELEQTARASQPFVEVELYIPTPFDEWEEEFEKREKATIFLAIAPADA